MLVVCLACSCIWMMSENSSEEAKLGTLQLPDGFLKGVILKDHKYSVQLLERANWTAPKVSPSCVHFHCDHVLRDYGPEEKQRQNFLTI